MSTDTSQQPSRLVLWGVALLCGGWFFAHALAPGGSPRAVWGIESWELIPSDRRLLLAGALSVCCLPPLLTRWTGALTRFGAGLDGKDLSRTFRAVAAVMFGALCWVGRTGYIYHGDGVIVAKIAEHQRALLHYAGQSHGRANAEQIVEFLLHRGVNALVAPQFEFRGYDTIALTHALCGAILVWLLTALFITWWPKFGNRQVAATALFLSMGVIQLWFGHIETYTIGSTLSVGFLWAGSRCLQGEVGLWQPTVWAALSMLFHPVFGGLCLGLLWVWWYTSQGKPLSARVATAPLLGVPVAVAVAGFIFGYLYLGFGLDQILDFGSRGEMEGAAFVPLRETEHVMERYTFLSRGHIVDLLNESALTAPFGLAILLGIIGTQGLRPFRGDPVPLFLVASTLVYGVVIVVINPPGGGRREWDVFSPPAVGYGLLAIYLLFSAIEHPKVRRSVAGAAVLVALAHTVPWIAGNARINLRAYIDLRNEGAKAQAAEDTIQALAAYESAFKALPTADLAVIIADLHNATGDNNRALTFYTRSLDLENRTELAAFGEWEHALVAMGRIYEDQEDATSALHAYEAAIRVGDERHSVFEQRALAYAGIGRLAQERGEAEHWFRKSIGSAYSSLGALAEQNTRPREAADWYARARDFDADVDDALSRTRRGEVDTTNSLTKSRDFYLSAAAEGYVGLMRTAAKHGEHATALTLAREAIRHDRTNSHARDFLAQQKDSAPDTL